MKQIASSVVNAMGLAACLVVGAACDAAEGDGRTSVSVSRAALFGGFDGKWCKISPSVASDGGRMALMVYGMLNVSGSDVFSGQYVSKSTDGGRTWGKPEKIPASADVYERGLRVSRNVSVYYSAVNRKWYAMGAATMYENDKGPFQRYEDGKPYCYPVQADVDIVAGTVTNYRPLPFPLKYELAIRFGQVVECENGDVLMPFYFRPVGAGKRSQSVVVRYRLGRDGWEVVRAGKPVEDASLARGIGEPSLVRFNGKYYLTLRSDECGMFAESDDGLNFSRPVKWAWADGRPIGNANTQQHWVPVGDRLYLAYTRVTPTNGHVFRNRAPIFIAEFDPAKRCLRRETEQAVVPERGARLGNFTVAPGCGRETWLVTAEWMQPKGCERYGSDNSLWLVKMRGEDTANVFIGTSGLGHATPAATVPFGMVQAGPDTSAKGEKFVGDWAHCSGYQHGDRYIWRFSQTHLSGTGMIGLGDLGVLPLDEGDDPAKARGEKVPPTETAEPGYYAVAFANGIRTAIAATAHGAAYRFAFPRGRRARVLVDLNWHAAEYGLPNTNFWGVFSCFVRNSCLVTDSARAYSGAVGLTQCFDRDVHFALEFSRDAASVRMLDPPAGKHAPMYVMDFGVPPDGVVELRLALSRTSSDAARRNLARERSAFEMTRANAAADWSALLGRVTLDPATPEATRRSFEAALYRVFFQPNVLSDCGEKPRYSTFSLWDTFRAAHPLYTLLAPERVDGLVDSLVASWERDGHLPIWQLWGEETHCMIGKHAVPVVVDAYLKGFRGFDVQKAFAAVVETLTQEHKAKSSAFWGMMKEDWPLIDRFGYLPFDGMTGTSQGHKVLGESVSRLLEGSYDDACAARFAEALGEKDKAAFFRRRAGNWSNVYDRVTGCVRGRDLKGAWREPFDPMKCGHCWFQANDFTEGNALQYTWHVMQDPEGLVAAMGGREKALAKLNALFEADSRAYGENNAGDVTGLIGQYAHGNEPSHHIIYFYTLLGRPDLAGRYVRQVFDTQYGPRPDGLCGNDDCGQMAAWYVFSALGFYPFDPCGGEYVVGAPQVAGATVALPGGRTLRIEVRNFAKENTSVESVALNGRPVADFRLRHADLMKGGTLTYVMRR